MQRALVLGAGRHAANAWELGMVTGLADAGIDVRNADLFVGTSAGSRVAVQIASGPSRAAFMRAKEGAAGWAGLSGQVYPHRMPTISQRTALEISSRISSLPVPRGLVTPFQAFGADFVLSLPGCSRTDIPSSCGPGSLEKHGTGGRS